MHARAVKIHVLSPPPAPEAAGTKNGVPHRLPVSFPEAGSSSYRVIFLVLAGIAFAYAARPVLVPVLLAWVIAMMLKPPVRRLHAWKVPRPLAAGLVVAVAFAGLAFGVMRLGQPALDWLQAAPENVPRLREKFQHILRPAAQLSEAAASVGTLEPTGHATPPAQPVEVKDAHVSSAVFSWTGNLLAGIGETVALVFLILATGEGLAQKLGRLVPSLREGRRVIQISGEVQQHISQYLFTVGLVNVGLGVVLGVVLYFLGVPNAPLWGSVAALLNFVPYFGPVLGMLAVALTGLLAFPTLGLGLLPAAIYLVLHLVEAYAVTPFVLGRRFTLHPVVIFVTLISCIWLWGVVGALLAMPLLVTLKVVCERVPTLAIVGDFLTDAEPVSKKG